MLFWTPNSCAVPLNQFILKQNDNSVNAAGLKQLKNLITSQEAHNYEIKLIMAT
jgi:hypothetical protein